MFNFTEEEIKEYSNAKDEQALAEIITRDAKSRGCIFVKQMNELDEIDNKRGLIT
jgi:hypothetical protein